MLKLFLGVFAFSLAGSDWIEPLFCHGLDCPIYANPENKTIDGQTVEIRIYEESVWAATVIENTQLKTAEDEGLPPSGSTTL